MAISITDLAIIANNIAHFIQLIYKHKSNMVEFISKETEHMKHFEPQVFFCHFIY